MTNNIELELRAEVSLDQFNQLLNRLNDEAKQISHTKRLSAMFLGKINESSFDLRARISSDGDAEIVLKKGDFHANDRIEISQRILKDQFIGHVKIFLLLEFKSKITERENFVFDMGNEIILSLVKAGEMAYVEIEKMSNPKNIKENELEILEIISNLGLELIDNNDQFYNLCARLDEHCDWEFIGSESHLEQLNSMLASY